MMKCKIRATSQLFGSIAVILFISCQYLNNVFILFTGSSSILIPIVMLAFILGGLSIVKKPSLLMSKKQALVITSVLLAYIFTIAFVGNRSSLEISDFIGMCFLPLLCASVVQIDYKIVLKGLMWLLCVSIPVFSQLFSKANYGARYDAITMSNSFSLIPIIMAGILHFIFLRRESSKLDKILYLVSFVYFITFIPMSYRGALLSSFFTLILSVLVKNRTKLTANTLLLSVFVIIIGVIIINHFDSIMLFLQTSLAKHSIKIAFIDKSIDLGASNNLSDGRYTLYIEALNYILQSPIWGHGISTYGFYSIHSYPHNFLLQFLFDGGLVLSIPLMWGIIPSAISRFKFAFNNNEYKLIVLTLLLGLTIIRITFSADIWKVTNFWVFVGMVLNYKDEYLQIEKEI